jgi:hypothetical protein
MNWAIIPTINLADMTIQAARDLLAQTLPTRVLIINNGSDAEERVAMERFAAENHPRVLLWSHDPPLPTLNATWNRALEFVWQTGAEHCLVPNNDVRLHPHTYARLLTELQKTTNPLFVSAVNAGDLFDINQGEYEFYDQVGTDHGGPDFSCFLISRLCHGLYPFDENLTYAGDLDTHRRMMIGGDGGRIYSINARYLHLASQTIKRANPEMQERFMRIADQHRQYYAAKWGGPVNQEQWLYPWNSQPTPEGSCTTTPDLQKHGCRGLHPPVDIPLKDRIKIISVEPL